MLSRMEDCWKRGFVAGSFSFGWCKSVRSSSSVRSMVLLSRETPKGLLVFWAATVRLTCGLGNAFGGD